jgi:hypothetical protein
MLKVTVTNPNKIGSPFSPEPFATIEEAQAWIDYCSNKPSKPFGEVGEFEVSIDDVSAQIEQEVINIEAQAFLDSTDWKVLRHFRQQALGISTSLTAEEYLELEHERQMAAESIMR